MRFLLSAVISCFPFYVVGETLALPPAAINQDVLGGRVLLIKMKAYVVVNGKENQSIQGELGVDLANQFFHDIVMTKSVEALQSKYNPTGQRKSVQAIIFRYSDTLLKVDAVTKLN